MMNYLVVLLSACHVEAIELYRAFATSALGPTPSYVYQGSVTDWQRVHNGISEYYQRTFPYAVNATLQQPLRVDSSVVLYDGTGNTDKNRPCYVLGMWPMQLAAKEQDPVRYNQLQRLIMAVNNLGQYNVTFDVQLQSVWAKFADYLGSHVLVAVAVAPDAEQTGVLDGVVAGVATGIATNYVNNPDEYNHPVSYAFRLGDILCQYYRCVNLTGPGPPPCAKCQMYLHAESQYIVHKNTDYTTPWLSVSFSADADANFVSIRVVGGGNVYAEWTSFSVADVVDAGYLIRGNNLGVAIGGVVASANIRNLRIFSSAIYQPDSPAPTPEPTPGSPAPPTPGPPPQQTTQAPTPVPTPDPPANRTTTYVSSSSSTSSGPASLPLSTTAQQSAASSSGSSGNSVGFVATTLAIVACSFGAAMILILLRRRRGNTGQPQYELTDMQASEPLRPMHVRPRNEYASTLTAFAQDDDDDDSVLVYTVPPPPLPQTYQSYAQISVSPITSGTGYGTPAAAVAAYGQTKLVMAEEAGNRQSAKF